MPPPPLTFARRVLLLGVVGMSVAAPGCMPAQRATPLERLPGVAALTYDGLDVHLLAAAAPLTTEDAQTLRVLFEGRYVAQARLRPGDAFAVTDGTNVAFAYRIISADDQRLILKRTRAETRVAGEPLPGSRPPDEQPGPRGEQLGYDTRIREDVVTVPLYGEFPRLPDPFAPRPPAGF